MGRFSGFGFFSLCELPLGVLATDSHISRVVFGGGSGRHSDFRQWDACITIYHSVFGFHNGPQPDAWSQTITRTSPLGRVTSPGTVRQTDTTPGEVGCVLAGVGMCAKELPYKTKQGWEGVDATVSVIPG